MKKWLATLFSVALIFWQAAFLAGAGDLANRKANVPNCCGHCERCGGPCCAAKDGSNIPLQMPAVPSHGISQNDWQLLTATIIQCAPQSVDGSPAFPSSSFAHPSFSAPLYQRNCTYLI